MHFSQNVNWWNLNSMAEHPEAAQNWNLICWWMFFQNFTTIVQVAFAWYQINTKLLLLFIAITLRIVVKIPLKTLPTHLFRNISYALVLIAPATDNNLTKCANLRATHITSIEPKSEKENSAHWHWHRHHSVALVQESFKVHRTKTLIISQRRGAKWCVTRNESKLEFHHHRH